MRHVAMPGPFRGGCACLQSRAMASAAAGPTGVREATTNGQGQGQWGGGCGVGQLELICAQHEFLSKPGCILFYRHSQVGRGRGRGRGRGQRCGAASVIWWCMFCQTCLFSDFDGTMVDNHSDAGAVRQRGVGPGDACSGAREEGEGLHAPWVWTPGGMAISARGACKRRGACQGEGGEVREGNGTRMVFPGHHRRRAANEGYEICVGAASHMPGGQAQPCLL